jgi:hypothetical protein
MSWPRGRETRVNININQDKSILESYGQEGGETQLPCSKRSPGGVQEDVDQLPRRQRGAGRAAVPACQGWESTTSTSTSPSTSMSSRRANQAAVPSEYRLRDSDPSTAGYSASGSSYWLCEQRAPRGVIKSEGNGAEKEGHRACASYWWATGAPLAARGAWRGTSVHSLSPQVVNLLYDGKIESIGRQYKVSQRSGTARVMETRISPNRSIHRPCDRTSIEGFLLLDSLRRIERVGFQVTAPSKQTLPGPDAGLG